MKGRAVPPSKEDERLTALLALDIPAMRTWAKRYAVGLLGDDQTVLISIHETRAIDPAMTRYTQRESVRWLREHHPESAVLAQASARGVRGLAAKESAK